MKQNVFVALSALFFLNQQIAAKSPEGRREVRCEMEGRNIDAIALMCSRVGQDGRLLGEILRQTQVFSIADGAIISNIDPSAPASFASVLAPRVNQLVLRINGNLTISDDCLAGFSNLESLMTYTFEPNPHPRVSISFSAFRQTPKLKELLFGRKFFFSDNTIKALESLKDQIIYLQLSDAQPFGDVMKLARKFTKLISFVLSVRFDRPQCPPDLFQNSAETLRNIDLMGCRMPQLPATMLANLSAVTSLRLVDNDITSVEPGAFDQLTNLTSLNMRWNKIKRLPVGIFEKNKMLEFVDFTGNDMENLSSGNFSHCPNFVQLDVGEGDPFYDFD